MKAMLKRALLMALFLAVVAEAQAGLQEGIDAYTRKDYATAIKEFKPLANSGDAEAQFYLGAMYDTGLEVPKSDQEAIAWYRKAAVQRNAKAQYNLGVIYERGLGVPQDYRAAVSWYRKAAEQG